MAVFLHNIKIFNCFCSINIWIVFRWFFELALTKHIGNRISLQTWRLISPLFTFLMTIKHPNSLFFIFAIHCRFSKFTRVYYYEWQLWSWLAPWLYFVDTLWLWACLSLHSWSVKMTVFKVHYNKIINNFFFFYNQPHFL